MSRDQEPITKRNLQSLSRDQGPVTTEDLSEEIHKLVTQAHGNGVEVDTDRLELRSDNPDIPDWEVDIWEL